MYLNVIPETWRNEPLKLPGSPSILYYKARSKNLPGTAFTTRASLIIFDTYEYFKGPAGKIQSFLMVPAWAKATSVSM